MSKKSNIGCVVIARTGSSRLPGKVLMPVKNEAMIFWLLKRISKIKYFKSIVVATSKKKVVEITADCPLIDPEIIEYSIETY